jgi:DNA-binding NarL/FixJ family response regulator
MKPVPWKTTNHLTVEEHRVLSLMASGRSVPEVAAMLRVPHQDVRRRLAAAIARLGARSKLEAIILALRQGLIDMPHH